MLFIMIALLLFLSAVGGFWLVPLPPPPREIGTVFIWQKLFVFFLLAIFAGILSGWLMLLLAKQRIRYTPSEPQSSFASAVRTWSWLSFAVGFLVALTLAVIMIWIANWVDALGSEMVRYAIATIAFWSIVCAGASAALLAYVVGATLSAWGGAYAFVSHTKRA